MFGLCGAHSFVPAHVTTTPSRAGAVKVGRHGDVAAGRSASRPRLDGSEHGGRMMRVGVIGMLVAHLRALEIGR